MVTNTSKSQSPQTSNNKAAPEPQKPASDTAPVQDTKPVAAPDIAPLAVELPVEPTQAVTQVAPAATNGAKQDLRTIISLSVSEKLARQIRLLAKLDGVTISNLVIASIEKEVPARLRVALAALTDLE